MSILESPNLAIEEIRWDSIRESVFSINPTLADVIEDINPGKKYTFYRVKYPYGAKIVEKGKFYLPTKDKKLLPITDARIPDRVKKRIGYCPIPLCLIMSNSNEVFVETPRRVVPLNFFLSGDLFGIFEVINAITQVSSEPMWSVTAGARTVFLLPRINDRIGLNKIRKEFNILLKPPMNLLEQFEIFKAIALSTQENHWENEIIIFSKEWFDDSTQQSAKFYKFLLTLCWKQLQLFRDNVDSDLRWSSFAEEMGNRNMKPRPYLVDMVKNLTSISLGATVAFIPAVNACALPINLIQQAYVDIYGLKSYLPTIMQPTKYNKRTPVYSSLSLPVILDSSPIVRNPPSLIEDERDIKRLIQIYTEAVKKHHSLSKGDPISSTLYDFYHTEEDPFSEIYHSEKIILEDKRFLSDSEKFKNRVACTNSSFFRGCIRISQNR